MWALATWAKWVPAPFWLILAPRGRLWGLVWLGVAIVLSIATLPLTIVQAETLFGFGSRPIRLDYLVLLWAAVPWLWRHPDPLWWLHPREWPSLGERGARAWGQSREAPAEGPGRCGASPRSPRPRPDARSAAACATSSASPAGPGRWQPMDGEPRASSLPSGPPRS